MIDDSRLVIERRAASELGPRAFASQSSIINRQSSILSEVWPMSARRPPLKRDDVGSTPTASTGLKPGSQTPATDEGAHDVAAACRLAMAEVWVRLPLGASCNRHGTPIGRAAELKPRSVWVRLPPVSLPRERGSPSDVRWAARPPVKRPPSRAMWVRFPPGALTTKRGSFFQRRGYQVVNLTIRVQLPYEPLESPCDGPFV
jgi:hypothetical protein